MTKYDALNLVTLCQAGVYILVASLYPSLGLVDEGVSKIGIVRTEEVTETVHQSECLVRVVPPYLHFHVPWFQIPEVNCGLKMLNGEFQK